MENKNLLSLIFSSIFVLCVVNAQQYTCPAYQAGVLIGGSGLGGINGQGLYGSSYLAQCCYYCLVVFNKTCAGYTYDSSNHQCFLATNIYYTQYGVSPCKLHFNYIILKQKVSEVHFLSLLEFEHEHITKSKNINLSFKLYSSFHSE